MASEEKTKLISENGHLSGEGDDEDNVGDTVHPKPTSSKTISLCKSFSKIPLSVYFIVGNEFCERFAFYGMRAVLVLYLTFQLNVSEDSATAVFHLYTFLAFFMPLFGSMIADSYIGKFKTILLFSVIYSIGCIAISLSAVPCLLGYLIPVRLGLCIIGLLLVAAGTGGIKPCVSAFGGDQVDKGNPTLLATFFSIFYFSINAGSLISIFLTPILRGDIQCFGADCFLAAFGVPAVLMVCSIFVFIAGSFLYVKVPPTGRNVYFQIFSIIFFAIRERFRKRKSHLKKDHWLDWAVPKYDPALVLGVKAVVKVSYMFIPLPIFWALFDQQGSRWLLQVTRMDTTIFGLSIHPDQVQIINPILILLLIPIFDKIIYPLVRLCHIRVTTLRKMTIGIFLAGVAFIISAVVQIEVENGSDLSAPNNSTYFKIFNPTSTESNVTVFNSANFAVLNSTILPASFDKHILPSGRYNLSFKIRGNNTINSYNYEIYLNSTLTCTVLLANSRTVQPLCLDMNTARPEITKYQASVQYINSLPAKSLFSIREKGGDKLLCNSSVASLAISEFCRIPEGEFALELGNKSLPFSVMNGDITSLLVYANSSGNVFLQPNLDVTRSVSFLWQVPMYVVMTIGEVMFSISGLEFAYSQSPANLKSVMLALWLLTVAFGNLLVFIVSQFQLFASQSIEFFFFAGAAILISVLFGIMSFFYKYLKFDKDEPQFISSTTVKKSFSESQRLAEKID